MSENQAKLNEEENEKLLAEESLQWMRFAQNDFNLVQHIYYGDYYPKPLEIICYHCSQAVEKGIKALIVHLGSRGGVPKVHDIQFLLTQIRNILKDEKGIEITDEMYDWGAELTKYSVVVRYPNELYVDENATKKAVEHTEAFFSWIKEALKK